MAVTKSDDSDARSPSAPTIPPSPSGTKRKRDDGPKFYAVHVGKKPGVYYNWDDAKAQLSGIRNQLCMKFNTLTEAEEFVKTGFSRTIKKYYGVRRGRVPGVYTNWPTVQEQITGWPKPLQRGFETRAEAEAFVNGDDNPTPATSAAADNDSKSKGGRRKQQKIAPTTAIDENVAPGEGPMPPIEQDSFDVQILLDAEAGKLRYKTERELNAAKMRASRLSDSAMLRIYTDGSALGNGKAGAVAGVGVYFGPQDTRNTSEPLTGPRQTNQRAELTAIQRALDLAPRDADITICTDSDYAIKCVTEWTPRWKANAWKTATGKPVENRDLIEGIVARIEVRRSAGRARTLFEWVKGHAGEVGNAEADRLAVLGAEGAKREGR